MERTAKIRTGSKEAGQTLKDLVCRRFDYLGRAAWHRHILEGRLLINGIKAGPDTRLDTGDTIEFILPQLREPPVNRNLSIIYDSRDLLVADKPANLPCHPAGRYFNHTLWALLKEELGLEQPIFIHRLDRETSGIVLVAKNRDAAGRYGRVFAQGAVRKRYLALVEGSFPDGVLRAEGILSRDPESSIRKKKRFYRHARHAPLPDGAQACCTTFRNISAHGGISLVEALPRSGRTHQIRASLKGLGFPVVGDKLYGVDDTLFLKFIRDELSPEDRRRLRLDRQALHASEIRIPRPEDGRMLCFCSPLPADIAGLLSEPAEAI